MKISVITDELSADPETALELASELGVTSVEFRGIEQYRVGDLPAYWTARLPQLVRRWGAEVVALSPGIFKAPLEAEVPEPFTILRWQDRSEFDARRALRTQLETHLTEYLPRTLALAKELGTKLIVVFGVVKPEHAAGPCPEDVVQFLAEAAAQAAATGVTLAVENEHICWADSGVNTARLVEKVGSPALKINWDPANSFYSGERPFPDGYRAVRDYVAHVHFKDAGRDPRSGETEYVVEGEIDWQGQLDALREDGYTGCISIETHCSPKVHSVRVALHRLRRMLGR